MPLAAVIALVIWMVIVNLRLARLEKLVVEKKRETECG